MTRSKTTKRALVASVCATLMCIAMLIGTTFAWFTDTASTSVNKIQSGTLDVTLEKATAWDTETGNPTTWESAEGTTLEFRKAADGSTQTVLWEPGCTYSLPELRISNNGNLALKYKIIITGINGDAELNDVIDWTITLDGSDYVVDAEHSLAAKTEAATDSDIFTISGHMKEEAGNDYQDLSIDGIAITVVATQDTVEYDSSSNQYDKDAAITVIGGNSTITTTDDNANIVVADAAVINSSTSIGKGTTISGTGVDSTTVEVEKAKVAADDIAIKDMTIKATDTDTNSSAVTIESNVNKTVIENVVLEGQGLASDTKGIAASGNNLLIKNAKISNVFRGIIFWDGIGGENVIEDCVIDNVIYTFNINASSVDEGTTLIVKNSTLNGWTSYSGCMSKVTFENCKLGKSNGYAYLRPYSETELTDCEFTSEDYKLNAGGTGAYTITLTNCTKNDTAITADNVKDLLLDTGSWNSNVTLIVNGTTVTV